MHHFRPLLSAHRYTAVSSVQKYLSSAQTAEALRPFLFAVHPDFFGQYPKEGAVNDRSLKQLFGYIDSIHGSKRITTTTLTFYLRNQDTSNDAVAGFRRVTVSLSSADVYSTVKSVLQTCDLSTALVDQFRKSNPSGKFPRPVEWNASYYAYTGKKDPQAHNTQQQQRKPELTLSSWLETNIADARKKLASSQPIRDEIETLKATVIDQLELEDVKWESTWDPSSCRSCLKTLSDLGKQHWAIMQNLRGYPVVLGDVTRLAPSGQTILGSQDVPHHWLAFVASLPQQREILHFIPPTEQHLSTLLGGCSVTGLEEPASTMTAHTHYGALSQLIETMEKHRALAGHGHQGHDGKALHDGLTMGATVVVEGSTGEQYMDSSGHLHIMCNKSAENIMNFILTNVQRARKLQKEHMSALDEEALLITRCLEDLQLATLSRTPTITPAEMISCCRQLEKNQAGLGGALQELRLRVSHRYALLRQGDVCIPWDWKE